MTLNDLQQILFQHQDTAYADFSAKLIPTVPREKIIGIRSPTQKPLCDRPNQAGILRNQIFAGSLVPRLTSGDQLLDPAH